MANVTPYIMDETGALSKVSADQVVQFTSNTTSEYETARLTSTVKANATNRAAEAAQTVPDFTSERNFDGLNDAVNRIADKLNLLTAEVNGKDDILIGPRNLDRLRDNIRILIKELYRQEYTDEGAANSTRFPVTAATRSRLDYLDKSLYQYSFYANNTTDKTTPYVGGAAYNGKTLYKSPASDFASYTAESIEDITNKNDFYNSASIVDILIDAVAGDQSKLLRKKHNVDYFNTQSNLIANGSLTTIESTHTLSQINSYQSAATKYRDSLTLKDRLTKLENALDKISLRTVGRAIFDPVGAPDLSAPYTTDGYNWNFLTYYDGLSSADILLGYISQTLGLTFLTEEDRIRLNNGESPSNINLVQLRGDYKTGAAQLKANKRVGLEGFAYTLLDHEDRATDTEAYRQCLDNSLNDYYRPVHQDDGTYKSTYSIGNEARYMMDLLYPTITQSVKSITEVTSGENNGLRDYGMTTSSDSSLDKVLESIYSKLPSTTSKTGKDNKAFIAGYDFTSSEHRSSFGSEEETALSKVRKIVRNDLETRFDGIYTELAKIQNALGFSVSNKGVRTTLNTSNFLSIVDSISAVDSSDSISFTTPWKTGDTEKSCHGATFKIKFFDKSSNEISSFDSLALNSISSANRNSIADYALSAWANSIYLRNSLDTHYSFIQSEMGDINNDFKLLAGMLRTLVGDTDYGTATETASIVPKNSASVVELPNTYTLEQLQFYSTYVIDHAVKYKADSQLETKFPNTYAEKVLPLNNNNINNTYFLTGRVYSSAATSSPYHTSDKGADVFMPMSEFDNWASATTQSFSDTITSYQNAINADLDSYKSDVDSSIKNCTDTVNAFENRVSLLESQSLSTDTSDTLGIVYRKQAGTNNKDDAEKCFAQVTPSNQMFDLEWKNNTLSAVEKQILTKNSSTVDLTNDEIKCLKTDGLFVNFGKDSPVLRTTQLWSLK